MLHQLYNLLVSKTFLFFIRASKHAISILLIRKRIRQIVFCQELKNLILKMRKSTLKSIGQNVFRKFTYIYVYFSIDISRLSGYPVNTQSTCRYSIWILKHYSLTASYMCHVAFDIYMWMIPRKPVIYSTLILSRGKMLGYVTNVTTLKRFTCLFSCLPLRGII